MIKPWKKLEQKVAYDCGFFQVRIQQSASPLTGKSHPFYILDTHNWTNIIAITPQKKVLFVSQFRHGTGQVSLEIPGGAVDKKDKDVEAAARRELLEETGHLASEWHLLGHVSPNPAILNNECYFYLALNAQKVSALKLDEAEELEVSEIDLAAVPDLILDHKIEHALVVAAFHYLELYRQKNRGKI
jgi:8-oxo-dGTP pyrophosphatase MutT (NUDIX family)